MPASCHELIISDGIVSEREYRCIERERKKQDTSFENFILFKMTRWAERTASASAVGLIEYGDAISGFVNGTIVGNQTFYVPCGFLHRFNIGAETEYDKELFSDMCSQLGALARRVEMFMDHLFAEYYTEFDSGRVCIRFTAWKDRPVL